MCPRSRCRGVSLIELIVAIVIIGAAVAGVLLALRSAVRNSVDPVAQEQALAIAKSLLEEIESMPFTYCDPDDPNVSTATGVADCTTPETLGPEAGETRYSATTPFDNVNDYNGFAMTGIHDVTNAAITGLEAYTAAVTVTPVALSGIALDAALQIAVTVTGPGNTTVTLDGYRTRYAPNSP